MKERMTLSIETPTAAYLTQRASAETGGNVSALVERLVRAAWLAEAVQDEVRWYAAHPTYVEDAEAERYAAAEAEGYAA